MTNSTGLLGLDTILTGISPGDSIVWQTNSIDDYMPYVAPFCSHALAEGKGVTYFRFAKHQALVQGSTGIRIFELFPQEGFEKFITEIHDVITQVGKGGYFLFDSLSDIAIDCYSERMTGNFFLLTCPLLYRLQSVAYFTVIRNYHSYHAAQPITQTTQVIIDVYSHKGKRYLHPLKVDNRYSTTMFMLHEWVGDDFIPVTESTIISDVSTSGPWYGLPSASYRMVGLWDRRFIQAEEVLDSFNRGECPEETIKNVFSRQLRHLISRDDRVLAIALDYLSLRHIIYVWKRTIGSGMIGGKSVGMLLARAILKHHFARYDEIIEHHDSFYIGSDIFYSFLVQNDCWHIRQKQKKAATLFEDIEEGQRRIMAGEFPDFIVKRFSDMLEYFGQAPVIVRSSSLLEDDFGNAFSGKYESIFCVNSGSHKQRLQDFLHAVRVIYASTMSREALAYRARRNVLEKDEQMALLVQRVSGANHNNLFFPMLAGVGISFNSYAWDESIDPEAGLLRLVFGLGTRAVERHDDDYTRVVALNAHAKRPEGNSEEIIRFSQKRVDVLDRDKNSFITSHYIDILNNNPDLEIDMFSTFAGNGEKAYRILNFDKVFSETQFIPDMREMLKLLRNAYGCHVDIEFTVNFLPDGAYKINLLQCRPHQVKGGTITIGPVPMIDNKDIILKSRSGVIGQSRAIAIDRIIYVVPSVYGHIAERDRYAVARLIGKLVHHETNGTGESILLIGPGRWGTHMPSLGVPVSFSEISAVSVVCEMDVMHESLKPDLSMGTHFFNDLVEMNILYLGFFATKPENFMNEDFLARMPNHLSTLVPESSSWDSAVRVIKATDLPLGKTINLSADSVTQSCIVYLDT